MSTLPIAFIQNLNAPEIILIFLIVLLLFGAKRLPELFRSFGKSIKEFKKATSEIEDEVRNAMDDDSEPAVSTKTDSKSVTASPTEVTDSTPVSEEAKPQS